MFRLLHQYQKKGMDRVSIKIGTTIMKTTNLVVTVLCIAKLCHFNGNIFGNTFFVFYLSSFLMFKFFTTFVLRPRTAFTLKPIGLYF